MSQSIFFAHANGFPSATYSKLFAALGADYDVQFLPQHAHDLRFPVNHNWSNLVAELIHHLQQAKTPVWGVGHSLGGVLHYHAATLHPELYKGLVLLDSPVQAWPDRVVISLAKRFGWMDKITPAGRTLGRREQFANAAQARDYFAGKTLFRHFDPDCLDAYVEHGLHADEQGLRLRFDPAVEISIYRNAPARVPGRLAALHMPLALVRGQHSQVVRPHHARAARRLAQGEAHTVPGGHMFPLEHPEATANLLNSLFVRWQCAAAKE